MNVCDSRPNLNDTKSQPRNFIVLWQIRNDCIEIRYFPPLKRREIHIKTWSKTKLKQLNIHEVREM